MPNRKTILSVVILEAVLLMVGLDVHAELAPGQAIAIRWTRGP